MTETFFAVIIIVAVGGLIVSMTALAWPFSVLNELGRTGSWFHHQDDDVPEALPDPNLNDPAIPFQPLRSRM